MCMSRKDLTSNRNHQYYSNCCAHRWAGLADPRTSNETCQKDEISRSLKIFWSSQLKFNVRAGYAIPRPPEDTWSYKRGFDLSDPWAQRAMCFGMQTVNMLSVCICLNTSSFADCLALAATEVWILQVSYPGSYGHKVGILCASTSFSVTRSVVA